MLRSLRSAAVLSAALILSFLFTDGVNALDDGLARTPPMGYRTWNAYLHGVNQTLMHQIADFLIQDLDLNNKSNSTSTYKADAAAVPLTLKGLGYDHVGLDDNWQACKTGVDGTFHDALGKPLTNKERFPDMKQMNDYIHSKGLKSGWYMNNCICSEPAKGESQIDKEPHYEGDAQALAALEFDGVKLDYCGGFRDLDKWHQVIKNTGRSVMIENCHWGIDIPTQDTCPFHFYRSSTDLFPNWNSIRVNIYATLKFLDVNKPLSRPGCWAYPDMLQVGNMPTPAQDRTHFGLWVIMSSPLILSFPINMQPPSKLNTILKLVSNEHAIGVNQAWAGHPGTLAHVIHPPSPLFPCIEQVEIWTKPLPDNKHAMLIVNHNDEKCKPFNVETPTATVIRGLGWDEEGVVGTDVFDVWKKEKLDYYVGAAGSLEDHPDFLIGGHDSVFLILSPLDGQATVE